MTTAVTEYKCRRCGVVFDGVEGGLEVIMRGMPNAMITGYDMQAGIPMMKTETHWCAEQSNRNRGMGVGDLIGFREVEVP